MAKTFQIHSAYNAQDWLRDSKGKLLKSEDGNPIVNTQSTYYNSVTGRAPIPHSIVVDQKPDSIQDTGHLPELLTAKAVSNLSKKFKDLLTVDDADYPLNTKEGLEPSEETTRTGNVVMRYRYYITKSSQGEDVEM